MSSRSLCTATLLVAMTLPACDASMPRSPASKPAPLVVASCPPLTPLADPSFGATTLKLVEVANLYRECRKAALQLTDTPPKGTP